MAQFIPVAKLSELIEGHPKTVEANGELIALFKINGTIYATTNTCPHQSGPLGQGTLEGDCIVCPLHGWKFNVKTGQHVQFPAVKIQTFEVKIAGDDVFVGMP